MLCVANCSSIFEFFSAYPSFVSLPIDLKFFVFFSTLSWSLLGYFHLFRLYVLSLFVSNNCYSLSSLLPLSSPVLLKQAVILLHSFLTDK